MPVTLRPDVAVPARALPAPGPGFLQLVGRIRSVHDNVLGLLTADHARFGDVVRYRRPDRTMHLIAHPEGVRHVLESHHTNFNRSAIYAMMKPVLGDGLVTSDGPAWQRQRRLMQPAFALRAVAGLGAVMVEETERLVNRWLAAPPERIDMAAEMMRLTLAIAGRTLFHTDTSGFADTVGHALKVALDEVDRRIDEIWNWPAWLPVARNRAFTAAVAALDRVVFGIIAERRRTGASAPDVLSILMDARDPLEGQAMTDRQLRDEVLTLLLAGHETTSNWLTWTWYLLAGAPDVERRMHEELARVCGSRAPTFADLPSLAYVRQVADESMRLFPPVWGIDRGVIEEDSIGGFRIPAGSVVVLSQYITHRHPEFWHEPTRFDPDRFAPENHGRRPKYAYFPFGGGPRQCLGTPFATQETVLLLSSLAQAFRFRVEKNHPVELDAGVTLRPRHGMAMNVTVRRD